MGSRKKLREKFFAEHPDCCFCAGESRAVEEDHFPSRSLFDDRQWPEGYVFPACEKCNRISRNEETVIAFLSRIYSGEFGDKQEKDFERYARSLEYNYPGLLQEMRPTAMQARNAVQKYGIPIPHGEAASQAPILAVDKPVINDAVSLFGRKLFLALYYKHTGIILPRTGGIALRWYSNLQAASGEVPGEQLAAFSGIPVVQRCNTSLGEQFFYRYGVTECKGGAAFVASFRQSFLMAGFVYASAERMEGKVNGSEIYRPFSHDA